MVLLPPLLLLSSAALLHSCKSLLFWCVFIVGTCMYIYNTQSYLSAYSQWQHCDSGSRECEGRRRSRVHLCHWWKCHHTLARLGFICKIHVLQSPLLFHFCIHYASLHPLPNPLLHNISILHLLSSSPPPTAPSPSLYIHSLTWPSSP